MVAIPTTKKDNRLIKRIVECTWLRILICQWVRILLQRKRDLTMALKNQKIPVTNKKAQKR